MVEISIITDSSNLNEDDLAISFYCIIAYIRSIRDTGKKFDR